MSDNMKESYARRIRDLLAQSLVVGVPYDQYLSENPQRWNLQQWDSALQDLRANWNRQSKRAQQIGDSLHAILAAMGRARQPGIGTYADRAATNRVSRDKFANAAGYTTAGAAERLLDLAQ